MATPLPSNVAATGTRVTDRDHNLEALLEEGPSSSEPVVALGRYQVLRALGCGGMGQVFEAWDTHLERCVAIKVLQAAHSDDLALREARCLARVAHPNVVGVHDVGHHEGLVFIAMELVDGPNLRDWLGERPRGWTDVLDRLIAAGRGLAAVHRAGLVHGDVKPGNVLIGKDGRVRIADFGLARVRARTAAPELAALVHLAADAEQSSMPAEAELQQASFAGWAGPALGQTPTSPAGTKAYMAPERLAGSGARNRTEQADQYSFCVMAWEALFGVRPFAGNSAETILGSIAVGRLERGRGNIGNMPAAVEAALRRGLSETPEQRWPSVEALVDELERARRLPRVVAVRRLTLGVLALAFVAVTVVLGRWRERERAASEVERQCVTGIDALERAWGEPERAALEQRLAASSVKLPHREFRRLEARLDAWAGEWSDLWSRACLVDPQVRACLADERARFEAALALLLDERLGVSEQASAAVGRALVDELGLPSNCLDGDHQPASAGKLEAVAELSGIEHRIAMAVAAGELDAAGLALAELEDRLDRLPSVAMPLAAEARVRLARWQIRLLLAEGEHERADARLRDVLAELEGEPLERQRYELLLERVRLAQRMGEAALDELAELHGLAESLELGVEARAELALLEVTASNSPSQAALDNLDQMISRLEGISSARPALMVELLLARGRLRLRGGNVDEAFTDAQRAMALGRDAPLFQRDLLAQAYVFLASASARAQMCDITRQTIEQLWTTPGQDAQPSEQLGWMLEIVKSFDVPETPSCHEALRDAWGLAAKLSQEQVSHFEWQPSARFSPMAPLRRSK